MTDPPAPAVPSPVETAPDEHAATDIDRTTRPDPTVSMRLFASIPNSFGRQFISFRPSPVLQIRRPTPT
ncbi:hypothetical protein IDVR_05680 [Intrasporangium sp. DVR]